MRVLVFIGLAAALTAAQSPFFLMGPRLIVHRTQSKPTKPRLPRRTTAHVIKIERAIITLPGYALEDYAACMKSAADVEELKQICKKLDEINKGNPSGNHPPRKESGYVVTFETATARYVVSTVGRCSQIVNGECGGEWVVDVVVGRSYIFYPPQAGETQVVLSKKPVKDEFVPHVELIGHLESVVEKKRAE